MVERVCWENEAIGWAAAFSVRQQFSVPRSEGLFGISAEKKRISIKGSRSAPDQLLQGKCHKRSDLGHIKFLRGRIIPKRRKSYSNIGFIVRRLANRAELTSLLARRLRREEYEILVSPLRWRSDELRFLHRFPQPILHHPPSPQAKGR
jgi:hypothetical protein